MLIEMPLAKGYQFKIDRKEDNSIHVVLFDGNVKKNFSSFCSFDGMMNHMMSLTDTQCNDLLKSERTKK